MTSTDWIALVVVLCSIVFTGFLAASEVAITRMNRVRAVRLVEEKRRGSTQLSRIVDNPAPYLNVVLFLTLLFTIGGATAGAPLPGRHFGNAGGVVAAGGVTPLLFFFSEGTPQKF